MLALSRELGVEFARRGRAGQRAVPRAGRHAAAAASCSPADPEQAARRLVHVPMGRFAEAREIANAALFLASDESSYVTAIDVPGRRRALQRLHDAGVSGWKAAPWPALLAALPPAVALVLLLGRVPPARASVAALAAGAAAAALAFPVPWSELADAQRDALVTAAEVAAIVLGGLLLAELMTRLGAQERLGHWVGAVSADPARRVLLVVLGVTPFAESVTGSGSAWWSRRRCWCRWASRPRGPPCSRCSAWWRCRGARSTPGHARGGAPGRPRRRRARGALGGAVAAGVPGGGRRGAGGRRGRAGRAAARRRAGGGGARAVGGRSWAPTRRSAPDWPACSAASWRCSRWWRSCGCARGTARRATPARRGPRSPMRCWSRCCCWRGAWSRWSRGSRRAPGRSWSAPPSPCSPRARSPRGCWARAAAA